MSQYVDLDYYKTTFGGQTLNMTDGEIQANINRAELLVNTITRNKLITTHPFEDLSLLKQKSIKDAICLITESFVLEGGYINNSAFSGSSEGSIAGASIGSFSYSKGDSKASKSGDNSILSNIPDIAYDLILSTGLLYAGIDVFDTRYYRGN